MKRCIPQEGLKLIACFAMLLDHIGAVLTGSTLLQLIGRISFPIFCFLLVQGIRHTRDPKRYLMRLGTFALLSELPYDLLFFGRLGLAGQNVMLTLLLGALLLLFLEQYSKPFVRVALILLFGIFADISRCDYGYRGILLVALFYLTDKPLMQLLGLTLISLLSFGSVSIFSIQIPVQLFSIFCLIPIGLYSGKKLTCSPIAQWAFYLFYPIHILAIFMLKI